MAPSPRSPALPAVSWSVSRCLRLLLASTLVARFVEGSCRGLDRTALIRLYEATDGANWVNNQNWNITTGTPFENRANDPCDPEKRWFGIGFIDPCERYLDDIIGDPNDPEMEYLIRLRGLGQGCFAGRITSINLRRNGLRGNFSISELGDLANLSYVDLSFNELAGTVPTELGRWNNVQYINLQHNSLEGFVPTELGAINSQGPPASTGCGIDDPCPEGVQMKLNELSLQYNSLSGSIPSELGELVHLSVLDLTGNNLTSSIPSELGRLTNLQVFYLRENRLVGSLPPGLFYNLTELRYLMFQQNQLTGAVPTDVGRLQKLADFFMYENRLDEPLPEEIGDMTVLQELRLNDNLIPGEIPHSIGNLTRLRHLDLYNNRMVGDVPSSIQYLINLQELYLQNEHLTPVRQRYCRTRIPNVGKYSWRIMREEYRQMTAVVCDDMHDVEFTFNSLQASSSYDATS